MELHHAVMASCPPGHAWHQGKLAFCVKTSPPRLLKPRDEGIPQRDMWPHNFICLLQARYSRSHTDTD
ncbi:hypothetical protein PISMIDRAFT_205439 [Pisolithus microcarpus 441]|uniref:Uncharacterized protein n=1 Tax=Pisolithus microcarpus 441 TaxID=765257 RepID=A0A0D0A5F8_9AGAM|nr:hypothetical protein PISMIDRAFT_205439 [Pisolithus microcarpus 441]